MPIKLVAPGKSSCATINMNYLLALSFLNFIELISLLTILFWLASNFFIMPSRIRAIYFALVIWPTFATFGVANVLLSSAFKRKARLGVNQKYLRCLFIMICLCVLCWLKSYYGFALLGLAWFFMLTTGMPIAMELGYRLVLLVALLISAMIQVFLTNRLFASNPATSFKSSEQEHLERAVSNLLESKNLIEANTRATECLELLGTSTVKSHLKPLDSLPQELIAANLSHCANAVSALYVSLSEKDK